MSRYFRRNPVKLDEPEKSDYRKEFAVIAVIAIGVMIWQFGESGWSALRLLGGYKNATAAVVKSGDARRRQRKSGKYEITAKEKKYTVNAGSRQKGGVVRVAYLESDLSVNRPKEGLYFDLTLFICIPLGVIVADLVLFWPQSKAEN